MTKSGVSIASSVGTLGEPSSASYVSPAEAALSIPSSTVAPVSRVGGEDDTHRGSDLEVSSSDSDGDGPDILTMAGITPTKVTQRRAGGPEDTRDAPADAGDAAPVPKLCPR